jgi:hypothetical protein
MSTTGGGSNGDHRGLQVAITIVAAFVIGLCAGGLSWLSGVTVAGAVLTGGGTFAGVVALILVILTFLKPGQ